MIKGSQVQPLYPPLLPCCLISRNFLFYMINALNSNSFFSLIILNVLKLLLMFKIVSNLLKHIGGRLSMQVRVSSLHARHQPFKQNLFKTLIPISQSPVLGCKW